ncbi:MAG: isochorismatase [Synechococcales cyanobacterium C42_A2020_086]|jgi:nicotinamidase-related amidase|nr:isochorismatase [Synechococcales cyanobacterium C42_A2020_086]
MTTVTQLPIPAHFQPDRVGEVWRVPYQQRAADAEAWAAQHSIPPAATDRMRIGLLAIDVQNTFCIPEFELFVGGRSGMGAVEDNIRLCQFIYRNLGSLSQILLTMDTHNAAQIFHSVFWIDAAGHHPPAMTMISVEDVEQGRWRVNPALAPSLGQTVEELQAYALHYVRQLSQDEKYLLTIWPYHSMLGGIGHAIVPAVEEACFFHSLTRSSPTHFEIKGNNPLTENYSVLKPEVMQDPQQRAIAQPNTAFLQSLLEFDALIIAGQAKSHCVAWTIADLLREIQLTDPQLAQKVYLLEDCTSPVVVPGVVDFTEAADATFQRFAEAGMTLVHSTQPMEEWLRR